jgi:hypothetical protein
VIAVTSRGFIQGYSINQNLKQFDLSVDTESKAASEKQLELSRKKIELQNKI